MRCERFSFFLLPPEREDDSGIKKWRTLLDLLYPISIPPTRRDKEAVSGGAASIFFPFFYFTTSVRENAEVSTIFFGRNVSLRGRKK